MRASSQTSQVNNNASAALRTDEENKPLLPRISVYSTTASDHDTAAGNLKSKPASTKKSSHKQSSIAARHIQDDNATAAQLAALPTTQEVTASDFTNEELITLLETKRFTTTQLFNLFSNKLSELAMQTPSSEDYKKTKEATDEFVKQYKLNNTSLSLKKEVAVIFIQQLMMNNFFGSIVLTLQPEVAHFFLNILIGNHISAAHRFTIAPIILPTAFSVSATGIEMTGRHLAGQPKKGEHVGFNLGPINLLFRNPVVPLLACLLIMMFETINGAKKDFVMQHGNTTGLNPIIEYGAKPFDYNANLLLIPPLFYAFAKLIANKLPAWSGATNIDKNGKEVKITGLRNRLCCCLASDSDDDDVLIPIGDGNEITPL